MNKAYNPIDWKNEPNKSTPINETNLNKMDRAIDTIDNRVISLDSEKVSKEEGKSLVSDTDISKIGANETAIQAHISDKSNPHSVTKAQVGLGNVDNTSDADKPISTEQQAEFDAINNKIDSNVNTINSNLDGLGYGENGAYNLIQPTLQTTTVNGVTCTNNEDGTYTLNGTSTGSDGWGLRFLIPNLEIGKKYKLIGFDTTSDSFYLKADKNNFPNYGNNGIFTNSKESEDIYIKYNTGVTFDNVIVKPMLTTDLTATYDDFKPYIPSVKMLADEVSAQNDSLGDYGYVNRITNIIQGGSNATGTYNQLTNRVRTDKIYAKNGSIIKIIGSGMAFIDKYDVDGKYKGYIDWVSLPYDFISEYDGSIVVTFKRNDESDITPNTVGHVGVYVDNAIDELKSDLGSLLKLIQLSHSRGIPGVSSVSVSIDINNYQVVSAICYTSDGKIEPATLTVKNNIITEITCHYGNITGIDVYGIAK